MTLMEKMEKLTPEQRDSLENLKDSAGLDKFLSDTGTDLTADEKAQVLEFITSGKLPLSDEEANAIAGGQDPSLVAMWRKTAESEGRPTHVGANRVNVSLKPTGSWDNANCPICGNQDSLFCEKILTGKEVRQSNINLPYETVAVNTKCYVCREVFGTCQLKQGYYDVYIQNWGY